MIRPWLIACWACALVACSEPNAKSAEDAPIIPRERPAAVDLGAVATRPGFSEYELDVQGQGLRSIAIWMPESPPELVMLFLHGFAARAGGRMWSPESQTRALLRCLLVPALASRHPVIIAPRSANGEWWQPEDTDFVLGLALAARRRWGRVVISGYSNGGLGTWYFARSYPSYFAAAIPIAFNDTVVGPTPLPVYAIEGTSDELFSSERVHAKVTALAERGFHMSLHERYRGSHLKPCSYVTELTGASAWLGALVNP